MRNNPEQPIPPEALDGYHHELKELGPFEAEQVEKRKQNWVAAEGEETLKVSRQRVEERFRAMDGEALRALLLSPDWEAVLSKKKDDIARMQGPELQQYAVDEFMNALKYGLNIDLAERLGISARLEARKQKA